MRRILDEQNIENFNDVLQMFDQNWRKPKTISEASNYIDQSGALQQRLFAENSNVTYVIYCTLE